MFASARKALIAALLFPALSRAQSQPSDVVEYYHLDALGNVLAVSNAAGVEIALGEGQDVHARLTEVALV